MNFKIFPSGVAVLPSAITGIDISDVFNDKFSVTVQTSSHCYHADTFYTKANAEKYVADLVAELQRGVIAEPVNVSHKNFSNDDFVINDTDGNVLDVDNFAVVWIDDSTIYAIDYVITMLADIVKIDTRGQYPKTVFHNIVKQSESLKTVECDLHVAVTDRVDIIVTVDVYGTVFLLYGGITVPIAFTADFKTGRAFCEKLNQKYGW